MNDIPRIDLASLYEGGALNNVQKTMKEVSEAAQKFGFFTVYNHGIPLQEMNKVFQIYQEFFNLPLKEKLKVHSDQNNRGYVPAGGEQVSAQANADYKECFDIMLELSEHDEYVRRGIPLYGSNQWPLQFPEMESIGYGYYQQACAVGHKILQALAFGMGDSYFFDQSFDRPMAMLRANYYDERPGHATDQDFGIAPHTDYGCLTVLSQYGVNGLEIYSTKGGWQAIKPQEGDLIINIGEMLEQWSAQQYKATLHRVIGSSSRRMSLALFYNPDYFAKISPVVKVDKAFEEITAGQYLNKRYQETYKHRKN